MTDLTVLAVSAVLVVTATPLKLNLGRDMGGCKTFGGGKRTGERTLPKIFGPLEKSFWSALSWISVQRIFRYFLQILGDSSY